MSHNFEVDMGLHRPLSILIFSCFVKLCSQMNAIKAVLNVFFHNGDCISRERVRERDRKSF
jgi:hypothetical protein